MNPSPTIEPTYHPTVHLPLVTDYQGSNPTLAQMSYVLNNTYYLFIVLSIICMTYCIVKYLYSKHCRSTTHFYHEDRPSQFILFYSMFADILVFIGMYFCTIKWNLFYWSIIYPTVRDYCVTIYPPSEINSDNILCEGDAFCRWPNDDDNGRWCKGSGVKHVGIAYWSIVHFALTVVELCRACNNVTVSPCLCCKLCFYYDWRDSFYNNVYWERSLWIGTQLTRTNVVSYAIWNFCRYGIFLLFMIGFTIKYKPYTEAKDYYVETEMILSIMIITIAKIVFQVIYFTGSPYTYSDREKDDNAYRVYLILHTLNSAFGDDIGGIIQTYLPLFYRYQNFPALSTSPDHAPEILEFAWRARYRDIPQDLVCGVIDLNVVLSHERAAQVELNRRHKQLELQQQIELNVRLEPVELQKFESHRRRRAVRQFELQQQTELSRRRLQRFAGYQLRQPQSSWGEEIQQLKHSDESLSCLSNVACPPSPPSPPTPPLHHMDHSIDSNVRINLKYAFPVHNRIHLNELFFHCINYLVFVLF
eukprot:596720_1